MLVTRQPRPLVPHRTTWFITRNSLSVAPPPYFPASNLSSFRVNSTTTGAVTSCGLADIYSFPLCDFPASNGGPIFPISPTNAPYTLFPGTSGSVQISILQLGAVGESRCSFSHRIVKCAHSSVINRHPSASSIPIFHGNSAGRPVVRSALREEIAFGISKRPPGTAGTDSDS